MYAFRILHLLNRPSLEKKRQEVTSRIAKYFAPSLLFMPFLLDTRANNVPKKARHVDGGEGGGAGKKNFVENIHRIGKNILLVKKKKTNVKKELTSVSKFL